MNLPVSDLFWCSSCLIKEQDCLEPQGPQLLTPSPDWDTPTFGITPTNIPPFMLVLQNKT